MKQTSNPFATGGAPQLATGAETSRGFHSASAEPALFRIDLARSLQLHRRLAMAFALAGLTAALTYALCSWRIYTAQSLVYIQPTPTRVLEGAAPMHWPYNYDPATYDSYLQQQLLSMTREDVLAGAVQKLGPGGWQQSGESAQSAAARLKGAIEAARVGSSYQVAITAHASNPETAAALANAVANSYIENTAHEQKACDAERLTMLSDERDRVKKELDDDRAEQAALNAQLGVAGIGPMAPVHYDDDIAKIHEELVKARADHDEAAARLTAMNTGNGGAAPALDAQADQMIAADAGLASLKTSLLQRRAALVSQMANLTPNHPQYKQDAAELAQIDSSLDSATSELRAKAATRIEEQLHADLDRTSGLEARLNGQLAQMTRAAAGATPKLQRASDLANDIARLQNRYSTVDEQLQNLLLEDSAPGTAHLAAAAVAPLHPAVAGVMRNAIAILVFFVLLAVAAAVAAHKMDPRIYVASDVENLLGYAPMAQLPDFYEVPEEIAGEHLLRLAAGIEYAAKEPGVRNCVFTGAGPGVGTTTIVHRVKETLGSLGRPARVVSAAAAGGDATAANSTALLQTAGEKSENILVLADTAPLAVCAETEYLARFADCTIVVIDSGTTTRAQLRSTASRLQRLNVATVGFVLNRVGMAKADAAFRNSVREMGHHLRAQNRLPAQPLRSRSVLAEPAWTGVEEEESNSTETTNTQIAPPPQAIAPAPAPLPAATGAVRFAAAPQAQPEPQLPATGKDLDPISAQSPKLAPAPAQPEPPPLAVAADLEPLATPLETQTLLETEPKAEEATPWWLTEQTEPTEELLARLQRPRMGSWDSAGKRAGTRKRAAEKPRHAAPEKTTQAASSPLSGLRNLFVSYRLKELDVTEDAPPESGPAAPHAAEPQSHLAPAPETKPAHEEDATHKAAPRRVTAAPEILPPKPLEATLRDEYEDVQTLPARRGQYKRAS
jgi:uncharacterized protein involved in exopolysaccharide biosynthesis